MHDDLQTAIENYLKGEATEVERKAVDAWYQSFDANPGLTDRMLPDELDKTMAKGFASLSQKLDLPVSIFKKGIV